MKLSRRILVSTLLIAITLAAKSAPLDDPDSKQCYIPKLTGDNCRYIRKHCDSSYFTLSAWYYCSSSSYPWELALGGLSLIILSLLTLILVSLSILVSNYLFRDLNELTKILGINNQILSFILVPLTNSFPDLINYFVALDSNSADLVIGQIVGSIAIMFTVIIGLICIFGHNFIVEQPRLLTIDLAWVLIIITLFSIILSDGKITLVESVIMLTTYVAYIIFLMLFDKDKLRDFDEELLIEHEDHQDILEQPYNIEDAMSILAARRKNNRPAIISRPSSLRTVSSPQVPRRVASPMRTSASSPVKQMARSVSSSVISPPGSQPSSQKPSPEGKPKGAYGDFLTVTYEHPDETTPLGTPSPAPEAAQEAAQEAEPQKPEKYHWIEYFFIAIEFVLFMLVPVHKDVEEDSYHWKSKFKKYWWLKYWYLIEVPLLLNFEVFNYSYWYVLPGILIYIPIVLLIVPHVKDSHIVIVITSVGIVNSLVIVSMMSIVLLQLLKNLGLIWRISDYILGLIVFSVSNSVNDLITNLTLATKINPILGINSCLGTPLLLILLGVGINGAVVTSRTKHPVKFHLTNNIIISTFALNWDIHYLHGMLL
ncbi:uncharacterized protein J8A68_003799 [[Candida] subhashii]|uniref:Sodium/calcium exchanger membrane region domain-containing protein n=1 Tax=[Candida] subhashii TaxID=561895 RepID=A0A8J5Q7W3_9ASCO|nr:uncharacterized protein J8A68_003799 [[Candida] subhashii]KAG7662669.1 hypothetical protein J8A68_003799 [[Candida] subhashii]